MTTENLSDVFGPSAAALAGRLPRRTADTAPAPAVPPQSAPEAPEASKPTGAAAIPEPDTRGFDPGSDLPAQISVYVLPAVVAAIRRSRRGRTNAQIAFQAITAVRDQLPALVARHRTPLGTKPIGPFAAQPGDRRGGPRRVLWTFKATGTNQRILDQLVDEVGAASRSELVAAALEAHLLHGRRVGRYRAGPA